MKKFALLLSVIFIVAAISFPHCKAQQTIVYDINLSSDSDTVEIVTKNRIQQFADVDFKNAISDEHVNYFGEIVNFSNNPKQVTGSLSGVVINAETDSPLLFANILVKRNNTVLKSGNTDRNGFFTIKDIPYGDVTVECSYFPYFPAQINMYIAPSKNTQYGTVAMKVNPQKLEAITIEPFLIPIPEGRNKGFELNDGDTLISDDKFSIEELISDTTEAKQTNPDTDSALSVNDEMKTQPLKTTTARIKYKYVAIPQLNDKAFFCAYLPSLKGFDLTNATANIYMDSVFIGKNTINPDDTTDGFSFKIGSEKQITAKRTQETASTKKTGFRSSKVVDEYSVTITLKNNLPTDIDVDVKDWLPLSKYKEVIVAPIELNGGKYNKNTEEVVWNLHLKSMETKTINFTYAIRHPKR